MASNERDRAKEQRVNRKTTDAGREEADVAKEKNPGDSKNGRWCQQEAGDEKERTDVAKQTTNVPKKGTDAVEGGASDVVKEMDLIVQKKS